MKNSTITVTDQFCGAGGSSQGVRQAAQEKKLGNGVEIKLAMNHWSLAIETHNTNFPDTDHVCTDISACDPRRYPSTTMLITSPECTVHSPAGGGQSKKKMFGSQMHISGKLSSEVAEERSRATMWDVPRFAEYHNYELIIAENVVEARKWKLFDTWLLAMTNLGYDHEIKYINSMHTLPTPQSRDRMYCVFWKKGNKKPNLDFNPVGPCQKCLKNVDTYQYWKNPSKPFGKYRTQYLYKCMECHSVVEPYFYAAFNCIDWSKPGTRIGDREKPLSDKTTARCQYGIDKYWDKPSFVNVKFSSGIDFRVKSLDADPLTSQPGSATVGLLNPQIISSRYIQGIGNRVKESGQSPLPVQVTDTRESVLFPDASIVSLNRDGVNRRVRSTRDVLSAQTSQSEKALLTNPLIMESGYFNSKPVQQGDKEPLTTQDTRQTKGILMPIVIKNYSGPPKNKSSEQELGAITTSDHHGILREPLIVENYGTGKSRPSKDRLPAITTTNKQGIITAESFSSFLSYYNGSAQASGIMEAIGTLPTKERVSLVNQPYEKPRLEDCFYRMLLADEVQLGMAFDKDYIVLGNSKQKVKQLGNAVTPPAMQFLVGRCIDSLL